MKRSPILGYNHNVRYAGRLWHIQTEDSGVSNPRIFTHLFHEGTILATARSDYDSTLEIPAVQKLMQGQHKQLLRELKDGAFDEKIERFFGHPISKTPGEEPALVEPPSLPPPMAAPVDFGRAQTLMVASPSPIDSTVMETDDLPLPGPLTDPSMPIVVLPLAEPADFHASSADADADADDAEITIEPAAPQPISPELTPIPPVPSVPRGASMSNLPRQPAAPRTPSVPNMPRFPSSPVISSAVPPRTVTPVGTRQPPGSRTTTPVGSRTPTPTPTQTPTPTVAPRTPTPPRNPVQSPLPPTNAMSGRIPSQPVIRTDSLRSPSSSRSATPPPGAPPSADDPLSQIPIFAAPSSAPTGTGANQNPPRRDATATPLRVPTRPATASRSDLPPPRRPSAEQSTYARRPSQTHGVVKPTSEGVVVARPAVVIGGNAPPASQRGTAQRQVPNRWHAQTPGQPPQSGNANPGGKGFGSDLISERSLDEVILAYLSEDAKEK